MTWGGPQLVVYRIVDASSLRSVMSMSDISVVDECCEGVEERLVPLIYINVSSKLTFNCFVVEVQHQMGSAWVKYIKEEGRLQRGSKGVTKCEAHQ